MVFFSMEETIPDGHTADKNGIKAIEDVTSAISRTSKQILNPDLCGEPKSVNGII